jgi:hypothetical protein
LKNRFVPPLLALPLVKNLSFLQASSNKQIQNVFTFALPSTRPPYFAGVAARRWL